MFDVYVYTCLKGRRNIIWAYLVFGKSACPLNNAYSVLLSYDEYHVSHIVYFLLEDIC